MEHIPQDGTHLDELQRFGGLGRSLDLQGPVGIVVDRAIELRLRDRRTRWDGLGVSVKFDHELELAACRQQAEFKKIGAPRRVRVDLG